uniref:Uncharacterized protein n=1 Tax=Anopheles coluzzii TaxID=1518534 RepID=A0A8W7PR00_ANOCL
MDPTTALYTIRTAGRRAERGGVGVLAASAALVGRAALHTLAGGWMRLLLLRLLLLLRCRFAVRIVPPVLGGRICLSVPAPGSVVQASLPATVATGWGSSAFCGLRSGGSGGGVSSP